MLSLEIIDGALVRHTGREGAPVLLFVPAFGDSGVCFREVFESDLADRYRLASVDLWGFGASPPRSDVQTFEGFCAALEALALRFCARKPMGLIGHSIAAAMATEVAHRLRDKVSGVFSIEGNLIPEDTMFTGLANGFDDPIAFKKFFLDKIWTMGQDAEALRHYYAGARMADAETMWNLGRETGPISTGNKLGNSYASLPQPSLYYWSQQSTPEPTQDWIATSGIANEMYTGTGHWPMVDQPAETADQIGRFFDQLLLADTTGHHEP